MPEPLASLPDQLTVKLGVVSVAGSAVTLLVGTAVSMVLRAVFVAMGALMSKTTEACWLILVPVVRLDLGSTVYWTKPSPMPALLSGGRKPSVTPDGAWPVRGSSEVKVAVKRPDWTLKSRATRTFSDVPSGLW